MTFAALMPTGPRRYGRAEGATGQSVVDDLIVDDGVKSRGHRLCVYEPRWRAAAVFVGGHATFGSMVAILFAVGFEDQADAVAAREAGGAPARGTGGAAKTKGGTSWNLGLCRGCTQPIKGGAVVEVPKLGKWHEQCFNCSRCEDSLAGVPQKKIEKGFLFCQPCWVALYARTRVRNQRLQGRLYGDCAVRCGSRPRRGVPRG